jgi:prepilin-type N-terminal cleavage/methylation domain-containing protein
VNDAGHARIRGRVHSSDGERPAQPTRPSGFGGLDEGFSLAELLVVLGLLAIVGAWSIAHTAGAEREIRLTGAGRLLANVCAQARAEAVRRGANVAVEFAGDDSNPDIRLVADGNANGIRRTEVDAGTDPEIRKIGRLGDHFRGVRLEIPCPCPGIDGGDVLRPGSDPLRVGSSRLLVFTSLGTSSGGTAYLAGQSASLVAVRVLGATGRVRALRCSGATGRWEEL